MLNERGRANSHGFSLIEQLVALVLFGALTTTLTTIIVRQHRLYVDTVDLIEMRSNLRQAADILPSELRSLSPARGDIYAMDSASIDFRLFTGSSVLCGIDPSRTQLTIPSPNVASRNGTSAWVHSPADGDSLLIYDHSASGAPDSSWRAVALSGPPVPGSCGLFASSAAESLAASTLTLASAVPPGIRIGAGIRLFRRARYELYDAADNLGYLGFSDCIATRSLVCSVRQPVSGPYLPLRGAPAGLVWSYFDSTNVVTSDPRQVARIDVTVRSRSRGVIGTVGRRAGYHGDSLTFSIAVRN